MSGPYISNDERCPNCGEYLTTLEHDQPVHHVQHACPNCGWSLSLKEGWLSLDELNDERDIVGLDHLLELPERDETTFFFFDPKEESA